MRAVIFDLGRVLVGIDETRGIYRWLTERFGARKEEMLDRLKARKLFLRFNRGELTPETFYKEVMAEIEASLPYDEFVALWCDIFVPMETMRELFQEVQTRVPVGLLSDTDSLHWNHLRRAYPFLQTIARPTLSFEIGATKPDPSVYLHAAQNLGVSPSDCLFLDDLLPNVEGARTVGMKAELFCTPQQAREFLIREGILEPS